MPNEPWWRSAVIYQIYPRSFFDTAPSSWADGGRAFSERRLASTGKVTSFTIVNRAAPGVPVPFVSAVVELDDGASVLANVVDVEPDPEHVQLGMPVRLTTYVAGTDDNGTEAVAFGFVPAD